MNVFPGTSAGAKLAAMGGELADLKARPGQPSPFPVGLWLDNATAMELTHGSRGDQWVEEVKSLGFCASTANAFPYGAFHEKPVKTDVYHPDWTTVERRDFTVAVAGILGKLLPEGQTGSISTLPGGYHDHCSTGDLPLMAERFLETAAALRDIHEKTGKLIRLGVEMEPDCLWESPAEFADFYHKYLAKNELSTYIGVCYDTCHQELLPGNPGDGIRFLLEREIPIVKIQLSAALRVLNGNGKNAMERFFQDKVYLHQTRVLSPWAIVHKWSDLPEALAGSVQPPWVCHFHVPVFLDAVSDGLETARDEMIAALKIVKSNTNVCDTLEIETYSYMVLPEFLKENTLADCMVKETDFVRTILT